MVRREGGEKNAFVAWDKNKAMYQSRFHQRNQLPVREVRAGLSGQFNYTTGLG